MKEFLESELGIGILIFLFFLTWAVPCLSIALDNGSFKIPKIPKIGDCIDRYYDERWGA